MTCAVSEVTGQMEWPSEEQYILVDTRFKTFTDATNSSLGILD